MTPAQTGRTQIINQTVTVQKTTTESPDTKTLNLDIYTPYQPGQFLQVVFPDDPQTKRSYSMSSSPTETGHMDFTVREAVGGKMSPRLVSLVPGTRLQVKGPFGTFTLPNPLPKRLIFLATGSGVTPFRGMSRHLLDTRADADIWVITSDKTPADLIFRHEFSEWDGKYANFHYVPSVTRQFRESWEGRRGRIGEAMLREVLPDFEGMFYLCGLPDFVKSIRTLLIETLRVPSERVKREEW